MLLVLLVLSIVSAAELNVAVTLNDKYGVNQVIDGILSLNFDELAENVLVETYLNNEKVTETKIKELLDKADINYDIEPGFYKTTSSDKSSISSDKLIGIKLPANAIITSASVSISGNTNDLSIDIGNDEIFEWQYLDTNSITWSTFILPEDIPADVTPDTGRSVLTSSIESEKCHFLDLTFDELGDTAILNLIGIAEKVIPGGDLRLRLNEYVCDPINEPGSSLTTVSCDVTIGNPISTTYEVCIYNQGGISDEIYYKIPRKLVDNQEYYFLKLRNAVFSKRLSGTIVFEGEKFIDALNQYLGDCVITDDFCIIPIKVKSDSTVNLDNLEVIAEFNIYNNFNEIVYEPGIIQNFNSDVPTKFLDVKAQGNINEVIDFKIKILRESSSDQFTLAEVPLAFFSTKSKTVAVGQPIVFDATFSSAPAGSRIVTYGWDFGDGTSTTTEQPKKSHVFTQSGKYNVTLTVIDNTGIKSSEFLISVTVKEATASIQDLINQIENGINNTDTKFSYTPVIEDTYKTLNIDSGLVNLKEDLDTLELEYESIKDSSIFTEEEKNDKYIEIVEGLIALQNRLIDDIEVNEFFFDNNIDFSNIPDIGLFLRDVKYPQNYEIAIFEFQKKFNIRTTARLVELTYLAGKKEEFILIKKKITTFQTPEYYLELIPFTIKEFITDSTILDKNLYKYAKNVEEIIYTIDTNDLAKVNKIKTLAIPDLSGVDEGIPKPTCGDQICQYNDEFEIDEADPNNEYYCAEDCEVSRRTWPLVLLAIIVMVGIYYINFYKGPWNFKATTNKISIKLFKRRFFTNKQDLVNLKTYVKNAIKAGYKKERIRKVLLNKGWTTKQIGYVFETLKK